MKISRRNFLGKLGMGIAVAALVPAVLSAERKIEQPKLADPQPAGRYLKIEMNGQVYWCDMEMFEAERKWKEEQEMRMFGIFDYNAGIKQRLGITE